MLKINQKGFALVETLIVSVFVMTIFTVIFLNFFPMMGEYERRQNYDDVDSIYKTFLFKRMFESNDANSRNVFNSMTNSTPYKYYNLWNATNGIPNYSICDELMNTKGVDYCKNLINETKATRIILTRYKTQDLKNALKRNSNPVDFGSDLNEYIRTLPYYVRSDNNKKRYNYRIIVMFERVVDSEDIDVVNNPDLAATRKIISFSTIGVDPQ